MIEEAINKNIEIEINTILPPQPPIEITTPITTPPPPITTTKFDSIVIDNNISIIGEKIEIISNNLNNNIVVVADHHHPHQQQEEEEQEDKQKEQEKSSSPDIVNNKTTLLNNSRSSNNINTSSNSINNKSGKLTCIMHRNSYIMTQLGGTAQMLDKTLEQLLDESDPESGMGFKVPGPQGFLSYTSESDQLKINNVQNKSLSSLSSSSISTATTNQPQQGSPLVDRKIKLSNSASNVANHSSGGGSNNDKKESTNSSSNKDNSKRKSSHRPLSRMQKNEDERRKRKDQKRQRAREKPIYVSSIQELPPECIKMIKKSRIPDDKLATNFSILIPILRFRTGFNLRPGKDIVATGHFRNASSSGHNSSRESLSHSANGTNTTSVNANHQQPPISPDNATGDVNQPILTTTTTTTTTSTKTTTTTTTTSANANANNNNNNNNANSHEIEMDDYDDGSRLENAIVPKGTTDLFDKTLDIKKVYKNLKQIGSGGFGSVFLAKSTVDKCEIAIKKIAHHSGKAQRTNLNEIGYLHFCKHPNIVNYLRSHLVEDHVWIAMEYMHGGTLTEAAAGHTFNESCIAFVAKGMLEGLNYLHSHQLVHRDIKSGNIMMTIEGKIKIVDFGLCVDSSERKLTHMAGSPFWMSPEMIRGDGYSCPSDIWSFGICLLELANGEPPNRKSSLNAMFTIATSGVNGFDKPERWSENFKSFIKLCLEMDPHKRSTAEQLLKHPWLQVAEHPETMKKILAQIFIANVMNHLDPI